MGRIEGKVALITGGASGIGKEMVALFKEEGAEVVAADIVGGDIHLDVSKEDHWKRVVDEIGRLDILVNNAGITGEGRDWGKLDPENISLEAWRAIHSINLDGTMLGCKYAICAMKERGGTIVNMSSRSGMVGVPNLAAYASSKAAVRNHTKSVALYCARQGYQIRCNSVHPAAVISPIWDEERLARLSKQIPMGRAGTGREVAYAVLYLASDESSYTTGSELVLDGGIMAGSSAAPGD